ncbi:MAG TPA: TetR/AcrR family transcriptional regulator [Acidimicrobiales bacterium]|nr:TetR/AcrR family transcriptional regulator [Acidimicrobiales bacterium]
MARRGTTGPGAGVTRREQAAASRADLVAAARTCFTELGYDGTTVAEVLRRAGMARGALYHYFPGGKAELFAAVYDQVNAAYHDRRDAVAALPSPLARVREGAAIFLALCTDESFARIVLADAPRLLPGQGVAGSTYALLRRQLDEAVRTGEARPVDPEAAAMAVYGAVRSAGEYVMAADDGPAAVRRAVDAVGVMVDGLRAPAPERAGRAEPGGSTHCD